MQVREFDGVMVDDGYVAYHAEQAWLTSTKGLLLRVVR